MFSLMGKLSQGAPEALLLLLLQEEYKRSSSTVDSDALLGLAATGMLLAIFLRW